MVSVVVLSTADFESAVWTNKQHLAVGLAHSGIAVYYVESLGLREPKLSLRDFRRVLRKLRNRGQKGGEKSTRDYPENLEIITPLLIPFHRYSVVRRINRHLVALTVKQKLPSREDFVLWTFSPLTYGLEERCAHVVYHSVDLLHTLPGVPETTLMKAEERMLSSAGTVIASSAGVARHLVALKDRPIKLWENVADTELFSVAHERPRLSRVIFAGNLTTSKVDISLLWGILDAGISLALAGPIGIDGSSGAEFSELLADERVTYLGNLSLAVLAEEVGKSSVGIIPYLVNDYTTGVFPMKVYEYLAAGLSVITTPLPSLQGNDIYGLTKASDELFVKAVIRALDEFGEHAAGLRRESALGHSWTARTQDAVDLIRAASTMHPGETY